MAKPHSNITARTRIHVTEEPGRDVALAMQHAPDVDVVASLDVEDQMRVARQRPEAQTGEVQLVCVAGRASGGMESDVDVGLLFPPRARRWTRLRSLSK